MWKAAAMGSNLKFSSSFKDTLIGAEVKALTSIMFTSRATTVWTVVLRLGYAPALTQCHKAAVSQGDPCVSGTAELHCGHKQVSFFNRFPMLGPGTYFFFSQFIHLWCLFVPKLTHCRPKPRKIDCSVQICFQKHCLEYLHISFTL